MDVRGEEEQKKIIQYVDDPVLGEAKSLQDKSENREEVPQGDLRLVKKLSRPAVVLAWRPTLEAAEIQAVNPATADSAVTVDQHNYHEIKGSFKKNAC